MSKRGQDNAMCIDCGKKWHMKRGKAPTTCPFCGGTDVGELMTR